MTGTQDSSPIGDTTPAQRRLPYDHSQHGPQLLLTLKDANHMAFSDSHRGDATRSPKYHDYICHASTAFWDAYLKADPAALRWLTGGEFAAALGKDGTFETKGLR